MTRTFRTFGTLVVVLASSSATAPVLAETTRADNPVAAADALFREGRDALAEGDYAFACERLRRSDELDPAPGTKLNLGECEALRGHVGTAWTLFWTVERELDATDVRLPIAKRKREALEPRVPKLVLTLSAEAPRDARVVVDGREFDDSAFDVPLVFDPGQYELVVVASGYAERRLSISLEEGKTANVTVAPGPARVSGSSTAVPSTDPAIPARPSVARAKEAATTPNNPSRSRQGLVVLGVGGAGLLVGGVAGLLTLNAKSVNEQHCDETAHTCDAIGRDAARRGEVYGIVTTASFIVGAAGVAIGTYLLVQDARADSPAVGLWLRGNGNRTLLGVEGAF